ncbi:hypothetical protein FNV43_RR04426 [Rhamnella rubrinervis]|uniref:Dof zinc finger protein n=1 Tax=Rhamnella rubrinervis TaxID=2594499 RepID=A0A8K0HKP8_9ROSA|nr:hypothetical protein FNV43_RR04426 [Rhamnella rubrinervis]
MVFSSIPVYLDPPNWHQQQNHGSGNESPQLPPLPPPPQPPHVGGAIGSIRPGSMADRARLAKIPQPETALKCPRCESTNTKFCYFNNYSLSQPRHFCKTCRRYWTRGGALRNVPVGGGCRRNKKSNKSSNRSKSPVSSTSERQQMGSINSISPTSCSADIINCRFSQPPTQSSFMASLQNLSRFGGGSGGGGNLGLNFSDIQVPSDINGFQMDQAEQWRPQQFPLLGTTGFDSSSSVLYPFQVTDQGVDDQAVLPPMVGDCHQLRNLSLSYRVSPQIPPSVKMEENHPHHQPQGLNLSSRTGLNISENNNQFWGSGITTAWTDLSGLNSSSTSHLL